VLQDVPAVGVGHVERIDHHQGPDLDLEARPPQPEHLGDVRVLEEEVSGELVVLLVERPPGDEDADDVHESLPA